MLKKLRMLHLYLGCAFAPMFVFFAVSGIWQTFRLNDSRGGGKPSVLAYLTTIHTSGRMKVAQGVNTLSSLSMKWLVVAMSVCLIFTIIIGVVLAFKYGRGKIAALCLLAGIAVPALLVALAVYMK